MNTNNVAFLIFTKAKVKSNALLTAAALTLYNFQIINPRPVDVVSSDPPFVTVHSKNLSDHG